jgi:NADPH:quinone reductase-like Zn-dependent oxidoreductase
MLAVPDTNNRSVWVIVPGGRIAQIGVLTGFASQPNILPLQFKNASINGICVRPVQHFERLNRFLTTYRIQPVIDTTFGFDEAPAAYQHLASVTHFGKIVIDFG